MLISRTRRCLVPEDDAKTFCPHGRRVPTIAALRTARQTIGDAPCACGLGPMVQDEGSKTCSKIKQANACQLLKYMHKACSYVPVWPLWHPCKPIGRARKVCQSKDRDNGHAEGINIALSRPGGYGGAAAPVPFPNTAVKRPSADGTSSQDAGE